MVHRQRSFPASRRQFITLLGGARGASSAQQDGRVRRIGWLMDKDESDSVVATYKAALREPLA
jgi:hypothetical protein